MNADAILGLMHPDHINRTVLQPHDLARETFPLTAIIVKDHTEFEYLITTYLTHHHKTTGNGTPATAAAFGEAKSILDRAYERDQFQEGYAAALQTALDGAHGGMRQVLNELADALKRRALANYLDHVYHHHINVLSKRDNLALSNAFYARFGTILRQFGISIEPDTFAWNTRAALDYHRQILEQIIGIAKKL